MRNVKLTIEYDGTCFHGWQVQNKNHRTVHGELQRALFQIFKKEIQLIGSGRTDSGVHARGQVANFKADSSMTPPEIQKAINAVLPADIVILATQDVPETFHAQYSAKSKTYRYTFLNRETRCALMRDYCHFLSRPLNLPLMRNEAQALIGRKDFKSFQAADPAKSNDENDGSTMRTIKRIEIKKKGDLIQIDIEANGFLYKMVRNIVGTLLEIASGKLSHGSIPKILKAKDRKAAGQTAPAKGLCLMEVNYERSSYP